MSEARRRGPAPAYSKIAEVYDAIYSWKDYEGDARRIRALVRRYGPHPATSLLDVGCGTGGHLVPLARSFEVMGLDLNPRMLRIARRKLPRVRFVRGRMEHFDLGRKFDVVVCLFSAIGYVRSERDLRRTFRAFAAHLRPGGVAIVEPWLTRATFREGKLSAHLFGTAERPIARMDLAERRGNRSVLDMHHLVGTPGGVLHWVERHDMALYGVTTYLEALRAAGFRARFLRQGLMKGRGLYVAVLPDRPAHPRARVTRVTRGSSYGRRRRGS